MMGRELLDGQYRVEREIGRGSSGVVLETTDLALERRVAIKIGPLDPPALKARFLREGRAAASLQSKYAVLVHRVGELPDGRPYIVMDLLEGRTFATAIAAEAPIDAKRAIDWMLQALDALGEAHAAGLVHRDVKPSNLFLADRAGRLPIVKVLDFGLVKDAADERLTQTGEGLGTPTYVAPEQISDAARSDARSDVWGAGVTLFELLTGKPPFDGDGVGGLLTAVKTAPLPPMPGVPSRLRAIVGKCLEKDPADRYANATDLARALEAVRPKSKRAKRFPTLFVASVLGGMLVAGIVAFVVWPRAKQDRGTAVSPVSPPRDGQRAVKVFVGFFVGSASAEVGDAFDEREGDARHAGQRDERVIGSVRADELVATPHFAVAFFFFEPAVEQEHHFFTAVHVLGHPRAGLDLRDDRERVRAVRFDHHHLDAGDEECVPRGGVFHVREHFFGEGDVDIEEAGELVGVAAVFASAHRSKEARLEGIPRRPLLARGDAHSERGDGGEIGLGITAVLRRLMGL